MIDMFVFYLGKPTTRAEASSGSVADWCVHLRQASVDGARVYVRWKLV